jgi:photosystem II stability/assembly factor-like uncharacterized protein
VRSGWGIPWFAAAAALAWVAIPAHAPARRAAVQRPLPTGGGPASFDAEEEAAERREAWFEERHRHPPDVDWRAVERENGRAAIQRANRAERTTGGGWIERGSENQAGSMHQVARSTDGTALYAGSDLGGLWRRTGTTWEPLGDGLYGGAHRIAILPPDVAGGPDVLLVVGNAGLYRSADDGATWVQPSGLGGLVNYRQLAVATDGATWLVGCTWYTCAVYRSTDRGAAFTQVFDLGSVNGDIWVPRTGDPVVRVLGEHLWVTADGGQTWEERGGPDGDATVELAGSEAGRLYAVRHGGQTHLWRSDDDGFTWTDQGAVTDYWDRITASAIDPDLVAYGGVEVRISRDGGQTFAIKNGWDEYYADPEFKLHADLMQIVALPDGAGGETWYLGTHGGVYESTDGLQNVQNISLTGLRVSQYYDVLTSSADPGHVLAGAQDQGWQRAYDAPWDADDRFPFAQDWSGDYGQLTSGDGTLDAVFGVYPGFIIASLDEAHPSLVAIDYPDDDNLPVWLPMVVADPDDPLSFYFLAGHLWRFGWTGNWWDEEKISNRDFGSGGGEYLSAMVFSPVVPDRAYAATSTGALWWSDDHGVHWELSGSDGPEGSWLYGAAVAASRADRDLAWVGGSGYGNPSVYRTEDGGRSWEAWDDGLPSTLVYSLCEAPDGSGVLFAGTETSAWRRGPDDPAWVDITGADAPITIYWSCEALYAEDTVRFATYGRGVWDWRIVPQGEGCFPDLDADADGAPCPDDCDDEDPQSFPGNPEDPCDGVDGNCDGAPESDQDGDGLRACEDCDDADPARHPGATDRCGDGIDQDCTGEDEPCVQYRGGGGCN